MGKVTVIISSKGGSGGSFTAAGLGVSLAKRGKSTAVVDCCSGMRCIDSMLGVSDRVVFDMGDVLDGGCDIKNAVCLSGFAPELYVMPAPLEDMSVSAENLRHLLDTLSDSYEYILADCHAGDLAYGLSRCFQTVIVAQARPLSVRNSNKIFMKCRECGGSDMRLVINRFDEKNFFGSGCFSDLDEVIDKVGARLLGIVPEDEILGLSLEKGIPAKDRSRAAYALDRIAARIDGIDIPLF